MSDVNDAFDAAADEAVAELDSVEAVDQGQVVDDTPEITEQVAESEPEVTPEPVATEETPWWEARRDEEIEYKGVKMTLGEALAGGLRQADYTRKQQAAAQDAQFAEFGKRLSEDLQRDPVGALRNLAQQLKLIPADQSDYDPEEAPDPAMVEISQVRSELDTLRQERLVESVRREIADARAKYPDFSDEVLAFVAEKGNEGIGLTIEQGYNWWKGLQLMEQDAAAKRAKVKADAEAAALTAARQAQVASGHSPAAGTSEEKDYSDVDPDKLFDAIAEDVFGGLFDD